MTPLLPPKFGLNQRASVGSRARSDLCFPYPMGNGATLYRVIERIAGQIRAGAHPDRGSASRTPLDSNSVAFQVPPRVLAAPQWGNLPPSLYTQFIAHPGGVDTSLCHLTGRGPTATVLDRLKTLAS